MIAAAVLGDATKVEMVDVATDDRFTALQSGEIDALVRNTTFTATRDGSNGATFLQPTFYDGQGMMVAADSGFASLEDMDGVIVCVAQGTTTEGNAAAEAARLGVTWEIRPFEDVDLIQEAFVAGQCDGWSSDTSQLTGLRSTYPDGPEALTILPEVFSKEPLAPAGRRRRQPVGPGGQLGDPRHDRRPRSSASRRRTSTRSPTPPTSTSSGSSASRSKVRRVLDPGLGLPPDFAYQVVKQVGNYGEIFEQAPRPARPRARRERAVDRWRPHVLAAVPLTSIPTATRDPAPTRRVPLWRDVAGARVGSSRWRSSPWWWRSSCWLYGNYTSNADAANIPTNFDFLDNPASFQITGNPLSAERTGARGAVSRVC